MTSLEVLHDIRVRMFLGGQWRDVSGDVFQRADIDIERGRPDESAQTPPQTCSMMLDNRTGDYSTRNPLGAWYGLIGRNTPLEVGVRTATDAFGRTSSNTWGSADTGQAYTLIGTAADFDVAAGVGTVNVPAATNIRVAYLATELHADADVTVGVTVPVTNITGGEVLPGNIVVRGTSSTSYVYARVAIQTDETVTVGVRHYDGTVYAASVVVPGLVHTFASALSVRVQAEAESVRVKVWHTADGEPYDWHVTATEVPKVSGWVGVRTELASGNSNAPLVVSYDNLAVLSARFAGEVANFPSARDTSGNDRYVRIQAADVSRRLTQGEPVVWSALRRYIQSTLAGLSADLAPTAYWALENGERSVTGEVLPTAGVGSLAYVPPTAGTTSGSIKWAGATDLPGSLQAPLLSGGGSLVGYVSDIETAQWTVVWAQKIGTLNGAYNQFDSDNGNIVIGMIVDPTTPNVVNFYLTTTPFTGLMMTHTFADEAAVDDVWHLYFLHVRQSGGSVEFVLRVDGAASDSYTQAGVTLEGLGRFQFSSPASATSNTGIAHVAIWDEDIPDEVIYQAMLGWPDELAAARAVRLCAENGMTLQITGDPDITAPMGAQLPQPLVDLLRECAAADLGSLYAPRGINGFAMRTIASCYAQDPILTLDYSNHEVAPPWEPVEDDQISRNDVTAERIGGGDAQAVLESGRMSVLPPEEGGIGRYPTSLRLNVASDSQLPDVAGFALALGTVDEERFPNLGVNLDNSNVVAANLGYAVLDVDVDDRLVVENAQGGGVYEPITQLVRGYRETLNAFRHEFVFNLSPESPYDVTELDTDPGYLDAESTVLQNAVDSDDTSLLVWSRTETWTTTVPYPLLVGGERMTCTACTAYTAPALIAATTAVHANNASVTPTMPGGTVPGCLLLILAAIRNSGTGTPNTPAGYTLLADASNFRLFGKIDGGAEVAPTITFTGGAANATCSAQMAAVTNVLPLVFDRNTQLNGSAQNITVVPPLTPPGAASCVIIAGWKQDDWTSVATLTGMAEVGDSSSTLGDDQGIVWDIQFCDSNAGPHLGGATSFTVTGGASAISRSIALTMPVSQTMTVTRSVNGVVKSHAANTAVHVADVARLAL